MKKELGDGSEDDFEVTNEKRADWAADALAAFPPAQGYKEGCLHRDDREDLICDLLANLLHLARREKLDPIRLLERAVEHFIAEEEALAPSDLGPEVHVALAIIIDGEDYHELGKKGRRRARRERARRMDEEAETAEE